MIQRVNALEISINTPQNICYQWSFSTFLVMTKERISELFSVITRIGSSHPEVFYKKSVLENLAKFTGKHLCVPESFF